MADAVKEHEFVALGEDGVDRLARGLDARGVDGVQIEESRRGHTVPIGQATGRGHGVPAGRCEAQFAPTRAVSATRQGGMAQRSAAPF